LEVYVDDIVIISRRSMNLIVDLEKTFNILRQFNIKLNLEKCTFGVLRGKLLGYVITERGIEADPNKISAIAKMGQVRNVKDVQWLIGCLATLSYFLSWLEERGIPCTSY
jgi:hypothetical protein